MSRPVVGITTYGPDLLQLPSVHLPVAYVHAVERVGGIAVLLPPTDAPVEPLLDRLDGLILSGGGDIDPAVHVGGSHETLYMVRPERDRFEIALARAALDRPRLPLLGICRGMQLLNVALGGDLELHLPDVRGDAVDHRLPPRKPASHDVEVEADSILAEIYGETRFPVTSWHHQEVRRLGKALQPIAHAADGVTEALVHEAHPFALGVQWHPEMQIDDDPRQLRIFRALVERAQATTAHPEPE